MAPKRKPILCLDFDGVVHWHRNRWIDAATITDIPTPGAKDAISLYLTSFDVQIFSARSHQLGGRAAISAFLYDHFGNEIAAQIGLPQVKPPALIGLDDRVLTFTGQWPSLELLKAFRPWNKP